MDSLTESIRKLAPWQMIFADDVVWEKDVLEGSLGEERNESGKSKDRVHVSEWNAIRKR